MLGERRDIMDGGGGRMEATEWRNPAERNGIVVHFDVEGPDLGAAEATKE